MNTTEKGDKFEDLIYKLLLKDIEEGNTTINPKFYINASKKKKYYSRYREKEIEFDIAIEVYQDINLPNLTALILVECKDYKGAVGVDQLNKFLDDIRDIAEDELTYKIRPIMAISSNLAESAFNKAKNRGVGFIKINENYEVKWILNRSFKQYGINQNLDPESIFVRNTLPEYYVSRWIFYYHNQWFNRFENYFCYILGLKNSESRPKVKYYSKIELEDIAQRILDEIDYSEGALNLTDLLSFPALEKVKLYRDVTPNEHEKNLLGRVDFQTNEIFIYHTEILDSHRDRFTITHEIAHILLGHDNYLIRDTLEETDLLQSDILSDNMIGRLEFQANYLAGCLLVPKLTCVKQFLKIYLEMQLRRRGKFWIYLDNQPENKMIANNMLSKLARYFNVSKSVIKIRLMGFGLLHDKRIEKISPIRIMPRF